ncbi:MAG TPA: sulfatase-like hydrolase/transferase, partial [Candidatus Limnocylindria bacterium]|nr:sulfatase-like hydrolase/transferase [Candidatus Limnocylindria bacterium]
FNDTLFVFVGDHGVHLRGSSLVPVDEYRVPALFFCPSRVPPARIGEVTSQIDLPPTIMGIVGGQFRSPFFGRDVLHSRAEEPFAVVIYNKKRYGIVTGRELIVLSETGDRVGYVRDGAERVWKETAMSASQARRADQAAALLRVAEDLLVSGRYTNAKG